MNMIFDWTGYCCYYRRHFIICNQKIIPEYEGLDYLDWSASLE